MNRPTKPRRVGTGRSTPTASRHACRPARQRPFLEHLEGRVLPSFAPAVSYPVAPDPYHIVVADFNNDGRPDLAVASSTTTEVGVLLGKGDGTFYPVLNSGVGGSPNRLVVADFNADGNADLAVTNGGGNNTVGILFGKGDGTFQAAVGYAVDKFPGGVAAGDWNGDGKPDLAVATVNGINLLLNQGGGAFQAGTTLDPGTDYSNVTAADLNGDHQPDLVGTVPGPFVGPGTVAVFLGKGGGTFAAAVDYAAPTNPTDVDAVALSSGGPLDLVVGSAVTTHTAQVSVLRGNGDGTFQPASTVVTTTVGDGFAVADLNGDGEPDLAVSSNLPNPGVVSVYAGNGDGTFQQPVNTATGGVTTKAMAAADLNGDGAPDLAVGDGGSGAVSVLLDATPRLAATTLLKDLVPGSGSSFPYDYTDVNGTAFFVAADGAGAYELWKSDGTTAGTTSLATFPITGTQFVPPGQLTAVGGTLFFTANDGTHGNEVWKSDGTPAGTMMVKDVSPNVLFSSPFALTAVGSTLYFVENDGIHGQELWKTDGTPDGTVMVADINPDPAAAGPLGLTNVAGTLYFSANDGTNGQELWTSDGSPDGTKMVADINPGAGGSFPTALTGVGSTVYFAANDGTHGRELWKSDGTPGGTQLVADVNPGPADGILFDLPGPTLARVGNGLFFAATDGVHGEELWKTGGTPAATVMLGDLNPGPDGSQPHDLTAVGNTLFFAATDGRPGFQLWKSDGTPAGTAIVKDVAPSNLTALGPTLYFNGTDGAHGSELWKSDGTMAGTVLVKDINPGFHPSGGPSGIAPNDSSPSQLAAVGGRLFFTATDPLHGAEPWVVSPGGAPAVGQVATGADFGAPPEVKVFDPETGTTRLDFMAYDSHFLGGVRVAMADVNSDGVPDIITAPGPSGGPDVRVFDGLTGKLVNEFYAYDPGFTGGVYVAAGFIDLDGIPDIVTGAGEGGGPHVKAFTVAGGEIRSFMAYDPAFQGGVRVAVGDTTGGGMDQIITAAGPGGGPHVQVFFADTLQVAQSFYAYDPAFHGGVYVAAGDVNGDGKADIITGAGAGGGPHVKVFSGADGSLLRSFQAYGGAFGGGVRVAATADLNGGPFADIVTAAGPGGGPHVKVFEGQTLAVLDSFYAYAPDFGGGIFVGGQ